MFLFVATLIFVFISKLHFPKKVSIVTISDYNSSLIYLHLASKMFYSQLIFLIFFTRTRLGYSAKY